MAPDLRRPQLEATEIPIAQTSPRPARRVLLVEDELVLAIDVETLLTDEGYVVLGPAPSVERALALIDAERPDAVLLDLNLNGEPSTPVAEALRERGIPFVAVSGYGETWLKEPALRQAPLVEKPYDHGELVRRLAEILG